MVIEIYLLLIYYITLKIKNMENEKLINILNLDLNKDEASEIFGFSKEEEDFLLQFCKDLNFTVCTSILKKETFKEAHKKSIRKILTLSVKEIVFCLTRTNLVLSLEIAKEYMKAKEESLLTNILIDTIGSIKKEQDFDRDLKDILKDNRIY